MILGQILAAALQPAYLALTLMGVEFQTRILLSFLISLPIYTWAARSTIRSRLMIVVIIVSYIATLILGVK